MAENNEPEPFDKALLETIQHMRETRTREERLEDAAYLRDLLYATWVRLHEDLSDSFPNYWPDARKIDALADEVYELLRRIKRSEE